MRILRCPLGCFALILLCAFSAGAQAPSTQEPGLKAASQGKKAATLPNPDGFQNFIVAGKLTLSVDDAIRLALANNTNVRLDHTQIETAQYAVMSALAPFDPALASS